MVVTVHLEDPLASRLRAQASARKVSAEEFVRRVVAEELDRLETSEQWQPLNRRRLALIRKRFQSGLTAEEEAELRQLQDAADRLTEAHDNQLLETARQLKEAIERLPPEAASRMG